MNQSKKAQFITLLSESLERNDFVSLGLMNKRKKEADLKKVTIRLIELKTGKKLSFIYRYPTNDITKNFSKEIGISNIDKLLETEFAQAEFSTTTKNWFFSYPEKGKTKLTEKVLSEVQALNLDHDHKKSRPINADKIYLTHLGVSNDEGKILKDKQAKYKQINKFIEIIDPIIAKSKLTDSFSIVDMGCGKGYLSFALYDHLISNRNKNISLTGIELRADLVHRCNSIARNVGFDNLNFKEGSIETAVIENIDVLIALHACNTATDDAIAKGIKAGAKVIICSPCCHKQIRKQMNPENEIQSITQFGILKERQAEIITDTIRAMLLKVFGYKTNVMEFISTEHTPKNLLIVGTLEKESPKLNSESLEQINAIKNQFGINEHHLEKLLLN